MPSPLQQSTHIFDEETTTANVEDESQTDEEVRLMEQAFERRFAELRMQRVKEVEVVDKKAPRRKQPVRTRPKVIKQALIVEFGESVGKIPPEILAEIFVHCAGSQPPSRILALVCKGWKALLLNTPRLWRFISAEFCFPVNVDQRARQLQRRIELSRSALLDVTLNISSQNFSWSPKRTKPQLFKLVTEVTTDRWESLTLDGAFLSHQDLPGCSFIGTFASLKRFVYRSPNKAFPSLCQLISNSKPPISELELAHIPPKFGNSNMLAHLVALTASTIDVASIAGHGSLASLPAHVRLGVAYRADMSAMNWNNVHHLTLTSLYNADYEDVIELPNLVSLSITRGGLSTIARLAAPKLRSLQLSGNMIETERQLESQNVASVFEAASNSIMMKPTSLKFNVSVTTAVLLTVLNVWSQLEEISLVCWFFSLKGGFMDGIVRDEALCPNLRVLILESQATDFDSDTWVPTVTELFKNRKKMPLKKVLWKDVEGGADEWKGMGFPNYTLLE